MDRLFVRGREPLLQVWWEVWAGCLFAAGSRSYRCGGRFGQVVCSRPGAAPTGVVGGLDRLFVRGREPLLQVWWEVWAGCLFVAGSRSYRCGKGFEQVDVGAAHGREAYRPGKPYLF